MLESQRQNDSLRSKLAAAEARLKELSNQMASAQDLSIKEVGEAKKQLLAKEQEYLDHYKGLGEQLAQADGKFKTLKKKYQKVKQTEEELASKFEIV